MLDILATLNEWSLGQIWDNLIIVKGRATFEDEKVARACEEGEALLKKTRGENEIRATLLKRAQRDGWQIPTVNYTSLQVTSKRTFNKLDARKVPVYLVNADMANKCWNSPKNGMEKCWKLPKMDRQGYFLSGSDYSSSSSNGSLCSSSGSYSSGCSDSIENSACAFDNPPKYIFIDETKKLVNKMKEMKTKPMFPSWMIHERELKRDIEKFNNLLNGAFKFMTPLSPINSKFYIFS